MKFPFAPKKKKRLSAATVTAAAGGGKRLREQSEYIAEPNVSLSSAVVVVLILHLVAVGGIFAFSSIKAHQDPPYEEPPLPQQQPQRGQSETQVSNTVSDPADASSSPAPAHVAVKTGVKDSGATYIVLKGESSVAIARKLHVSYEDLLKLNRIEDPKKLRIGQKLKVPVKRTTT